MVPTCIPAWISLSRWCFQTRNFHNQARPPPWDRWCQSRDGDGCAWWRRNSFSSCFWLCCHVLESLRWPRISPYLMISWEHPNNPPTFNQQFYNEIHSACWHSMTSRECLLELNDALCGLIFFIDRTHVVALKGRLPLCPVMFSLSIIPQWLRFYSFSWRPLGFLKKLFSSKIRGQNMTNHHPNAKGCFQWGRGCPKVGWH
jgi:hypothetical protein